jgi:hypothetical protein
VIGISTAVGVAYALDVVTDTHVDLTMVLGQMVPRMESGFDDLAEVFTGCPEGGIDVQVRVTFCDDSVFKGRTPTGPVGSPEPVVLVPVVPVRPLICMALPLQHSRWAVWLRLKLQEAQDAALEGEIPSPFLR